MSDYSRSPFESAKRGAGTLLSGALSASLVMVAVLGAMWTVEIFDYITPGDMDRESASSAGIPPADGHLHRALHAHGLRAPDSQLAAAAGARLSRGAARPRQVLRRQPPDHRHRRHRHLVHQPDVFTVGASGLVFGYFGYVVARGLFDRHLLDIVIGIGTAIAY